MPAHVFEAARDAAYGHRAQEAIDLLQRGGLPGVTAQALGRALEIASPLAYVGLARAGLDGQPAQDAISAVVSPYGAFFMTTSRNAPPLVRVDPGGQAGMSQWLGALY